MPTWRTMLSEMETLRPWTPHKVMTLRRSLLLSLSLFLNRPIALLIDISRRSQILYLPDDYLEQFFPRFRPGQKRSWWKRSTDRKRVLMAMVIISTLVLVLNTAWVAYFAINTEIKYGIGTVYRGTRSQVKRYSLWIHLLINLLSTILLGTSNYCMQLLVAPTREEVDKIHKEHKWLDIGIQSVRNLGNASNFRKVLWFCLAISSGGLHLM
jgi:hypothetical protein